MVDEKEKKERRKGREMESKGRKERREEEKKGGKEERRKEGRREGEREGRRIREGVFQLSIDALKITLKLVAKTIVI
jgi:hypothetical protein